MIDLDLQKLERFERQFDASRPEASVPAARLAGFGEISMILEIPGAPEFAGLVLKRMPIFRSLGEARRWEEVFRLYHRLLAEAGVAQPETGAAAVSRDEDLSVFYAVQRKLDPASVGNRLIHRAPDGLCVRLFEKVLGENLKVWSFNAGNGRGLELALDSQLSNWAAPGFDPARPETLEGAPLLFLDTSTPFVRDRGREQMDAEMVLKSCPSFLAWLVKLLFMQDVIDRYYDPRRNVTDIIANLYKEGRPDLVGACLEAANRFFAGPAAGFKIPPLTGDEIKSYYRQDAFIWTLFLRLRKIDRFLQTRILRRPYHFLLPEKIERHVPR